MASKKTKSGGKKKIKRVPVAGQEPKKEAKKSKPEPETKRVPKRVTEKDQGFGVIKTVAGVLIALVVGSMILFNLSGGQEDTRGDKISGERCAETLECQSGSVCYSYKDAEKRCMMRCSKKTACDSGYTCVAAAQQKGRKGIRITDVCVEDDEI